jgi:hypothetical protein
MLKKSSIIAFCAVFAVVVLVLVLGTSRGDAAISLKKLKAETLWKTSGHADKEDEPFIHWNEAGSIPTTCAKCHSTPGFKDFLGADGSAPGVVDSTAPTGTTVECDVCHTDKEKGILREHPSVVFPSGAVVNDLGPEGLCMECHQGRASKLTIDTKIASAGVPDDDTSSTKLSFSDIHYYAASATQFGTVVKGGYEYANHEYDARFSHITGYNACITCHNPHSLQVNLKACNTCHTGITDPKDIRFIGSQVDYDGDGNIQEGMYYEIQHIMAKALDTIQRYALTVLNWPIGYDGSTYPYWFFDTNGNGTVDPDEANSANGYNAFSARLLKGAYNYQVAVKDPNNFVHNGKYIIELLYDSIEDLNQKLAVPTDLSLMNREDEGHFNGGSMPFRDWDSTGIVPSTCSRCHSATGLAYYLQNGTTQNEPSANGFLCTTCHTTPPVLRSVPLVIFPSGLSASLGDESDICMVCHQGREAKSTVDATINANPNGRFSFVNIHYFPAAATFFGTEVKGGYEFAGKVYAGRQPFANHGGRFNTCVECHMSAAVVEEEHNWTMRTHNVADPLKENCVPCHGQDVSQTFKGADADKFDFEEIRPASIPDYDADGNTKESLKDEIAGLEAALYAQIRLYTAASGSAVAYDLDTYPYWFKDLNNNGIVDPDEAVNSNRYSFDAKGLRAAYNYQMSRKDPHGFIHNARYIAQLLVDSIEHLGGDIRMYTWR